MTHPARFGWVDYIVFALMLLISSGVGVYHAWRGAGSSTSNYLLGGKRMAIFPIAMSLAASLVSSTMMMGVPTDIYLNGTMYTWNVASSMIALPIVSYFFLPVFHELQLVSVNKYLELRFNHIVRRVSSFINLVQMVLFLGMLSYGPALALTQFTGIDVFVCCGIILLACTFYTTLGGMKAVVWTDTFQIILMTASVTVLVVKGVSDVGFANVWQRNLDSGRLEFFNVDPDPTVQYTIWSVLIGNGILTVSFFGTSQGFVQRFLAMPTKRQAQLAVWISTTIVTVFKLLSCSSGMIAYAKYYDCDPLKSKLVKKADQIIPYFVMDTFGGLPGFPGLFVAGVFSASLSSLSTYLNGAALIVLEDFVRPFYPDLSEKWSTRITKLASVVFGCMGFGFVYVFSSVKTILDATISVGAAGLGASLGIFTLGMLFPWANSIGAGMGMALSYTCIITLGMMVQNAKSLGLLPNKQRKPLSIENCPIIDTNTTTLFSSAIFSAPKEEPLFLLRISFLWYALIGTFIVLVVGILISFFTGPQDPGNLDPRLVFHFIKRRVGHKRTLTAIKKENDGENLEEKTENNFIS